MALARHAQEIGADGILAITPYFWTPTLEAIRCLLCAALPFDRSAGADVQLPELSRRRRDHRRSDGAADRTIAEFRRRQGGEFQQRKIPGDFACRARDAAGLRRCSPASSICCHRCRSAASALIRPRDRFVRTSARSCSMPAWAATGRWHASLQYKMARLWHAIQRPVPLLAQRRHGDDGPPRRADPRAVANRDRGAPGVYPPGARGLGILDTEPHGW